MRVLMFDNCIKCKSTYIGFIGTSRIEEWRFVEYPKYAWKCYECNCKWDFQGHLMPEGFVEGVELFTSKVNSIEEEVTSKSLDVMKHRLEYIKSNNNELDVKSKILNDWYLEDVKLLITEVEKLQNKNIQLKSKLDKGPCGKCKKEM